MRDVAFRVLRVSELPEKIEALAEEASAEEFWFVQRLRGEWASGENRFDAEGEAFFVAHVDGELAGVCGLNRDPYADGEDVGRVRRLYVAPRFRRRGVARQLVAAVMEAARHRFGVLRLWTNNPDAARFYESLGFSPVAEDNATHGMMLR